MNNYSICRKVEAGVALKTTLKAWLLHDYLGKKRFDWLVHDFIYVISIISETQENKVFSMFESINSKGKKLDEIDLIKSFIFSKLKPNTYQKYLNKWGVLTIKTGDNLYDYLQIYFVIKEVSS